MFTIKPFLAYILLLLTSLAPVSAHYRLFKLIANAGIPSKITGPEYGSIRLNTNCRNPVVNLTSLDLRYNVGGISSAIYTTTALVSAGSEIEFESDIPMYPMDIKPA
ncbi:hypothetical protein FPQ18DRAFT_307377 [Pyronema domesticum]|nr:hypothetical protein FPQ18DRAFT_307377 [Pyronema domesticum]